MLSVDNVAGTEDDVVVVEFDEMRLMLSHADGDVCRAVMQHIGQFHLCGRQSCQD